MLGTRVEAMPETVKKYTNKGTILQTMAIHMNIQQYILHKKQFQKNLINATMLLEMQQESQSTIHTYLGSQEGQMVENTMT